MKTILFILCFSSVVQAADVAAWVMETKDIITTNQKTKLLDLAKTLFNPSFTAASVQTMYCSRTPYKECDTWDVEGKCTHEATLSKDICRLEEEGTCTRAQYAQALKTSLRVTPISLNGDTVTYRRSWSDVEIVAGPTRTAVLAFLAVVYPGLDLQFLKDFTVRKVGADIKATFVSKSAINETDLAQEQINGKLHSLASDE